VLLLVHGITGSYETWRDVLPLLARSHRVIAPDLPGHGRSDKPRGDYSLGAHACALRDLMIALDIDTATLVGHSLGGGVVMQFAYQFPELCERLGLVSSGGLGQSVHPALRAAALPGSEYVLPLIAAPWLSGVGERIAGALGTVGLQAGPELVEIARGYASLGDPETREAFLHTLRSVVDPMGQRVGATDKLYLAAGTPVLLVWGERDPIIPIGHARRAHDAIPDSRLIEIPGAGHFPHLDDPYRFATAVEEWIAGTEPGRHDAKRLRELLLAGGG
jgi:pimeloyl-ACP methyl ester carboxylesterase